MRSFARIDTSFSLYFLGSGVERIYEGDPAPTECFDELIAIRTEEGVKTSDLIPWKHKNPHRRGDYLVIICDPRPESPELRAAVKSFLAEVPTDILKRMIVVNADSPSKNRRWLRKDGLEFSKISVYSDEKMEFMRSYTVSGRPDGSNNPIQTSETFFYCRPWVINASV